MLWPRERLVSLYVEVNIGGNQVRDFVNTFRATLMVSGGHPRLPTILLAHLQDFF